MESSRFKMFEINAIIGLWELRELPAQKYQISRTFSAVLQLLREPNLRNGTLWLVPTASASLPIEIPTVPSTVARRMIVGLMYARTIVPIEVQEEPSMTIFPPLAHVALTVRDLEVSVPWYTALFEDEPVLDEDTGPFRHVVWMVSGTLVGLHQFPDSDVTTPFSERRAGLDHVAFGVADRAELEIWEKRLDHLGVSHDSITDAGYGSGLSFRDPDGLPLEFFAPPA